MRIGARLSGRAVRGVLADAGHVLGQSTAVGARALGTVLHELGNLAPHGVRSVTLEISDLLVEAVRRPRTDLGVTPVSVLRVLPRVPRHAALADHPSSTLRSFVPHRTTVSGGHDLFGTPLAPLDVPSAVEAAREARRLGLEAIAVVATGAVGAPGHESAVAKAVLDAVPDLRVSLSHEVGGMGLLVRETAAVLNAALLSAAGRLVDRCQRATRPLGDVPCWFATGDGGRVSAERLRALPVLGLQAKWAMTLLGAAVLNGRDNATIVVEDGTTCTIGEVRDGLPHVAADLQGALGVRLAAPQPVLTTTGTESFRAGPERSLRGSPDVSPVVIGNGDLDLATVGAASCEPTSWVDLVVHAGSTDELRQQQRATEDRACGMVATSDAPPGSERIVESSATALAYVRAGTYRLRVRAAAGARP
ncbi:hydantoinase/oxoprolinase family protein [Prauserella flavalba]|uniref:hypothetical protein n=1 Tax=Prauserella flavalba TaxID=1477506 RepID=UPI000D76CF29|nr:hypothetical protein [Prauserella flavalba]